MALTEIARLLPWLALHRLTRYPLSLISTLQKGHLYFAKQGTFLFCIDRKKDRPSVADAARLAVERLRGGGSL